MDSVADPSGTVHPTTIPLHHGVDPPEPSTESETLGVNSTTNTNLHFPHSTAYRNAVHSDPYSSSGQLPAPGPFEVIPGLPLVPGLRREGTSASMENTRRANGVWRTTVHGSCPNCHHFHRHEEVPVIVGEYYTGVRCSNCRCKWFGIGRSDTRPSLASQETIDFEDPVAIIRSCSNERTARNQWRASWASSVSRLTGHSGRLFAGSRQPSPMRNSSRPSPFSSRSPSRPSFVSTANDHTIQAAGEGFTFGNARSRSMSFQTEGQEPVRKRRRFRFRKLMKKVWRRLFKKDCTPGVSSSFYGPATTAIARNESSDFTNAPGTRTSSPPHHINEFQSLSPPQIATTPAPMNADHPPYPVIGTTPSPGYLDPSASIHRPSFTSTRHSTDTLQHGNAFPDPQTTRSADYVTPTPSQRSLHGQSDNSDNLSSTQQNTEEDAIASHRRMKTEQRKFVCQCAPSCPCIRLHKDAEQLEGVPKRKSDDDTISAAADPVAFTDENLWNHMGTHFDEELPNRASCLSLDSGGCCLHAAPAAVEVSE